MSIVTNPKELYGHTRCECLLANRQIKDHYKLKVPDGIYDRSDHMVRYVIIDGQALFKYSSMWLESGAPEDAPREVALPPFGYYPDYRHLLPKKKK
jgi:hypothetical protein